MRKVTISNVEPWEISLFSPQSGVTPFGPIAPILPIPRSLKNLKYFNKHVYYIITNVNTKGLNSKTHKSRQHKGELALTKTSPLMTLTSSLLCC